MAIMRAVRAPSSLYSVRSSLSEAQPPSPFRSRPARHTGRWGWGATPTLARQRSPGNARQATLARQGSPGNARRQGSPGNARQATPLPTRESAVDGVRLMEKKKPRVGFPRRAA
jgi:hypothetical protein